MRHSDRDYALLLIVFSSTGSMLREAKQEQSAQPPKKVYVDDRYW
jgi:hypothetical protein